MNTLTRNNVEYFMMTQVNTMQQSKLSAVKKKNRDLDVLGHRQKQWNNYVYAEKT